MKRLFPEKILNQPIAELDLSEKFKTLSKKYGYQTLADMLQLNRPQELLKHEGFDMVMLMEFTNILTTNGMRTYLTSYEG